MASLGLVAPPGDFVMPADSPTAAKLKVAQILGVQIVPGSDGKVSTADVEKLIGVIEKTDAFRGAQLTGKAKRVTLPQGVALIFTSVPDAAVRCAIQISKTLESGLRVRMGLHDGPVGDLSDTDEFSIPEGVGFEQALRVTECGDAGHILLTREMAGGLGLYGYWQPYLQHLGEYQMNGQRLSIVNLFTGEAGRQDVPRKLAKLPVSDIPLDDSIGGITRQTWILATVILVAALGAFLLPRFMGRQPVAAQIQATVPEKSIAVLPFENISGNAETASFTDGVHDEILTHLAKVSELKVISRTSVLQYKKGTTESARDRPAIGRSVCFGGKRAASWGSDSCHRAVN